MLRSLGMSQLLSSRYLYSAHVKHNMEVVVNVRAALTTTEESQLGVITDSKRKLITSEKENPQHSGCCCGRPIRVNNNFKTLDRFNGEQTDCVCMFNDNCSNLPATLVEEGAELLFPSSSFEISLPAHRSMYPNATHTNIKHHA